jgi:hypothetical protein
MRADFSDIGDGDTVETSLPTLGSVINEVRWDYDPAQRLLSPLVAAAKYFEEFPWNGEPEEEPAAGTG